MGAQTLPVLFLLLFLPLLVLSLRVSDLQRLIRHNVTHTTTQTKTTTTVTTNSGKVCTFFIYIYIYIYMKIWITFKNSQTGARTAPLVDPPEPQIENAPSSTQPAGRSDSVAPAPAHSSSADIDANASSEGGENAEAGQLETSESRVIASEGGHHRLLRGFRHLPLRLRHRHHCSSHHHLQHRRHLLLSPRLPSHRRRKSASPSPPDVPNRMLPP
eukprot:gnl/Spiro4/468_TR259_c0_g1_i3.p1 gnl/Spiro4/468_TR259_c0_g1~~gnl/Spiro4/468_TR259_c0_g1_i3.p1  ORF type:complete len:224 (-),score=23.98 gnl/Spiro4/468_TR259_c0_g1_i3:253-897(-)